MPPLLPEDLTMNVAEITTQAKESGLTLPVKLELVRETD